MADIYVSSANYAAVTQWAALAVYGAGTIRRQLAAPAIGGERVFKTTAGGVSGAAEPTWVLSPSGAAQPTDGTITDWVDITGTTKAAAYNCLLGILSYYFSSLGTTAQGTGYTVNDVLTSPTSAGITSPIRIKVTTVGGSGNITAFNVIDGGMCNAAPGTQGGWTGGTGANFSSTSSTSANVSLRCATTDRIFVDSAQNENSAVAMIICGAKTAAGGPSVYCVDFSGSTPPVNADTKNTAVIGVTSAFTLQVSGYASYFGITFAGGNVLLAASNSSVAGSSLYDQCNAKLVGAASGSRVTFGSTAVAAQGKISWKNSGFNFSAVGQAIISNNCLLEWFAGGTLAGSVPTTLFASSGFGSVTHIHGVDLSSLGAAKTIIAAQGTPGQFLVEDCKVDPAATLAATPTVNGARIVFRNCINTNAEYVGTLVAYQGTITTDAAVFVNSGASDGTNSFSYKAVATANDNKIVPLESFPMGEFYAGALNTPISVTFEVMTDNDVLTNDHLWASLEYLGSSASPLGSFISSGTDPLVAAANLTVSAASWTTPGIGTPKPQKITVTFTPQIVGLYRATLRYSKASGTMWFSPPYAKAA